MIRYLVVLSLMAGCSSTKSPKQVETPVRPSTETKVATWHGLPVMPGLPPTLTTLKFGMDRSLMTGKFAGLLTEKGVVLSPKSTAKAKLSADGTLRYLLVNVNVNEAEFTKKWSNGEPRLIDNRNRAQVWYLPQRSVQIQLKTQPKGVQLTYVPVTPIKRLVGIANDAGNTFASLIGKPISASKQLFIRMEPSTDKRSFLAWASPLVDETVSLKAHLRHDQGTQELFAIDLFLKDDEKGTLKKRLETVVQKNWLPAAAKDTYEKNGVTLRFGHIQRLSRRKRANYPFTLHLTKRP